MADDWLPSPGTVKRRQTIRGFISNKKQMSTNGGNRFALSTGQANEQPESNPDVYAASCKCLARGRDRGRDHSLEGGRQRPALTRGETSRRFVRNHVRKVGVSLVHLAQALTVVPLLAATCASARAVIADCKTGTDRDHEVGRLDGSVEDINTFIAQSCSDS
jgi:hypothetical protein